MPRLSLWRPEKGNDYKFFDRRIYEMFVIGGTDIHIHKYLGPAQNTGSTDATQPEYVNQSEKNIQDLLFGENRDRKYDPDVYTIRGVYTVSDLDFDLSQFGLFLANDTIFITFHYNDMIQRLGRKIIAGDVLELPHLTDYHPLGDDIPAALKRFYVVQEAARASEGYSATWYSHLWRVKCTPLVDSQEYKDILKNVGIDEYGDGGDTGTQIGGGALGDLLSTYQKNIDINDAVIAQAEAEVPLSGYDTSSFYVVPVDEQGQPTVPGKRPEADLQAYLGGDGLAPNGYPVVSAIVFPDNPEEGTYVLRLDYTPNRLFRYTNGRWIKIEDKVRTPLTHGPESQTLRSSFINNSNTTNLPCGQTVPERQSLSQALRIKPDN